MESDRKTLRVGTLLARARQATGLMDFGDPWFMEPLSHLLEFVNRDVGPLHDADRRTDILVGNLSDRLRLIDHLKRHPEVRDVDIDVAGVIVVGRGGSTLLQRLLASSPQLTSAHYWELAVPVPEVGEVPGDVGRRVAQGQARVDAMYEATPELKGMHPMDAMTYDEEIVLMERSFLSLMFCSYFNLPDYMAWQRTQDHSKAYEELRLWLQVLTAQAPQRRKQRWLLKSVHHLLSGGMNCLLRTFTDAKIIITHRHMENVIASSASGQSMLLGNFENRVNNRELGPRWLELYRVALRDMIAVRGTQPAARFIDIQFRDLVADPLAQYRSTMQRMGLTVGPEDEAAAAHWIAENSRDKHPAHPYRLEDYGLTRRMIDDTFGFYHDSYLKQGGK
jgi:hypothetical protein